MDQNWNTTYIRKGIVQTGILPTVIRSVEILQQKGCKKILDLCCGTGRHTVYLAQSGFTVYGVDTSQEALHITSERVRQENLTNVMLKLSDMRFIDFPDNFFDGVICVWSTGHGYKEDLEKTIAEMYRVLKLNGILLADFPSNFDNNYGRGVKLEDNTYLHPFLDHADVPHFYCTEEQLRNMLKPYFIISDLQLIDYDDPKYNSIIKAFWIEGEKDTIFNTRL